MKKEFKDPEIELIKFDAESDIVTASATNVNNSANVQTYAATAPQAYGTPEQILAESAPQAATTETVDDASVSTSSIIPQE